MHLQPLNASFSRRVYCVAGFSNQVTIGGLADPADMHQPPLHGADTATEEQAREPVGMEEEKA